MGSLVIYRLSCAVFLLGVFLLLVSTISSLPLSFNLHFLQRPVQNNTDFFDAAAYPPAVAADAVKFPSAAPAGSQIMAQPSTTQTLIHLAAHTRLPPARQLPAPPLEDTIPMPHSALCLKPVPLRLTTPTMRLRHPCTRLTRIQRVPPRREEIRSIPSSRMAELN